MKKTYLFALSFVLGAMLSFSTAQAGSCAIPANAAELAQAAGQAMNAERAAKGRPPLRIDPRLQAAATAHACDMSVKGYFSHQGRNGSKPKARVRRQGCRAGLVAENIAVGLTNPQEQIRKWMGSPGHRKNILLGKGANQYGIGIANSGKAFPHGYLWVLVIARGC